MTEAQISADVAQALLDEIEVRKWWQGSVLLGKDLPPMEDGHSDVECWVVASQACNIYNASFQNVPVFELVSASRIGACDPGKIRGDNPRILHVEALSNEEVISLELDIQKRRWLPRSWLAQLPAPFCHVRDAERGVDPFLKNQWRDKFAAWMGRSYTRVALPDAFNDALKASKIREVLEDKLAKHKNELYGIYLELSPDSGEVWEGVLGEMPAPYLLGITLVTFDNVDPDKMKEMLVKSLFKDEIKDPASGDSPRKIRRVDLAARHKIRIIEADIAAKTVSGTSIHEIMGMVRYSLVDHLSDSSMAVA